MAAHPSNQSPHDGIRKCAQQYVELLPESFQVDLMPTLSGRSWTHNHDTPGRGARFEPESSSNAFAAPVRRAALAVTARSTRSRISSRPSAPRRRSVLTFTPGALFCTL